MTVRLPDGRRKDLYLGTFGTAEANAEYSRIVTTIAANPGDDPSNDVDPSALSMNELIKSYLDARNTFTPADRKYAGDTDSKFTTRRMRERFDLFRSQTSARDVGNNSAIFVYPSH